MSNRARTGIALSLTFALALSFQPAAIAASPEPVKGEHGMVVTAAETGFRRGCGRPARGRQRGRCGGCRGLCPGGRLSCCGQSWRRWLHDDPAEGRAHDLPRFSRTRTAGFDEDHVSRRQGQSGRGPEHRRLPGGRRAGVGHGLRDGPHKVRHACPRKADGASDPSRPRGLQTGRGRHRILGQGQ